MLIQKFRNILNQQVFFLFKVVKLLKSRPIENWDNQDGVSKDSDTTEEKRDASPMFQANLIVQDHDEPREAIRKLIGA